MRRTVGRASARAPCTTAPARTGRRCRGRALWHAGRVLRRPNPRPRSCLFEPQRKSNQIPPQPDRHTRFVHWQTFVHACTKVWKHIFFRQISVGQLLMPKWAHSYLRLCCLSVSVCASASVWVCCLRICVYVYDRISVCACACLHWLCVCCVVPVVCLVSLSLCVLLCFCVFLGFIAVRASPPPAVETESGLEACKKDTFGTDPTGLGSGNNCYCKTGVVCVCARVFGVVVFESWRCVLAP